MRVALLFSGQGSLAEAHLHRFERLATPTLAAALGPLPLAASSHASATQLSDNRVAQPLIFAFQIAVAEALRPLLPDPVCVAGHSLGHLAACCMAGAFTPQQGLALCRERARCMDAAVSGPHGLLAVVGLDEDAVVRLAAPLGVQMAIRNAPRHCVLAGASENLERARERLHAAGAAHTVRLAVQTPSHTPHLSRAAEALRGHIEAAFAEQPSLPLQWPLLDAVDGSVIRGTASARASIARQLATPLDWWQCMQTMLEMRPDVLIEIGPGNALARMVDAPGVHVRSVDDFQSLQGLADWIGALAR